MFSRGIDKQHWVAMVYSFKEIQPKFTNERSGRKKYPEYWTTLNTPGLLVKPSFAEHNFLSYRGNI